MKTQPAKAFLTRLKYFLRVYRLVWEASPRYALLALLTTIASSIMLPAQMWISKVVIDNIFIQLQRSAPQASVDWGRFLTPAAAFILVWLVGVISQTSAENYNGLLADQLEGRARYLVLRKASSLSISFFENPTFFNQMENARSQIYRLTSVTAMSLQIFRLGISFVSALLLLTQVAIWVPLVLLIATMPQAAVRAYFANKNYGFFLSRSTAERKLHYFSWLLTTREPVKEIRLFKLQNHFLDQFQRSVDEYFEQIRKLVLSEERANVGLSVLAALGTLFVWVYAIIRTVTRSISVGDLALTFQAAELCRNTLSEIFQWSGSVLENSLFIQNLFEFLDLPPDSVEGALTKRATDSRAREVPPAAQPEIEFRHVSFRYPGTEKLVLEDVSFVLHPGEKAALVGENGAGKTTIVKLLARLYEPTGGKILFCGRDLRELEPEDYYPLFGIIFQDFVRYSMSAGENIGLGKLEEMGNVQRIRDAASKGGALEMIEMLPKGFDTVLGRDFEDGVDLSGGEWQKVALSRAFMRESPILILDEPTSSLDALAEYDIYNRFAELTAGKMTIFISHRLSSCKMADHILFLKDGRLIEEGTHGELRARQGEYYKMFTIQAERYR